MITIIIYFKFKFIVVVNINNNFNKNLREMPSVTLLNYTGKESIWYYMTFFMRKLLTSAHNVYAWRN